MLFGFFFFGGGVGKTGFTIVVLDYTQNRIHDTLKIAIKPG